MSNSIAPAHVLSWSFAFPTSFSSTSKEFFTKLFETFRTLYLFTRSDLKTILMPVTVFASMMTPSNSAERLPLIVSWIWLHLLQFCVSNQSVDPEEDAINKPWRPIAAGRITINQARIFRWYLTGTCLSFSAYFGVFPASLSLCMATIAYNDLAMHRNIVMRNVCNAVGYASFELGATQLAGKLSIRSSPIIPLTISALIILTTIHAGDFRDEKGDLLVGKETLPIVFPEASRILMLFSLLAWSGSLAMLWNVGTPLAIILTATGILVGCSFIWKRDVTANKRSYLLYNIWLSLAHVSLGIGKYKV